MTLKDKTKKGLIWSSIERFATQGIQFIFGIILARLLAPSDYGIIAMPIVFLAIAQCFIDSGFSSALVRKQDLKEEDLSTAFYFNIIVGIVCYAILFFVSPLIADFYDTPILADLLKVTALATLFNPLCAVQQALLTRKIDFRTQAVVSVTGASVSGCLGIYMAFNGFGVWSLVCQQVGGYLIRTILLWKLSTWRPKTGWSRASFGYLWNYGSKMLAAGLLDTIYNNLYTIVIGKVFSAKELGNYTRAQQISQLPSQNITGVLQRVTFPVLSSIQDEDGRLQKSYRKILKLSAFAIFPMMLCLSAIADPLVRILLGDKWEGCIILLQIVCFAMMWYPIHAINLNLLQVKGRSDLFLRLEIFKKIIGVSVLCLTIPHGVVWMVSGSIITSMFCLVINTYYTGKLINVGYLIQMRDLFPIFLVSLVMWTGIHVSTMHVTNIYIRLIVGILVGLLLFFALGKTFLNKELTEIFNMLPTRLRKKP